MILLHQVIAYPEPQLSQSFKLPSICSAGTCQVATQEITKIVLQYLKYTPIRNLMADQCAFCVFISARVLLSLPNLLYDRKYANI